MTDNFNPTEWITTKEAAELTGYQTNWLLYELYRLTEEEIGVVEKERG